MSEKIYCDHCGKEDAIKGLEIKLGKFLSKEAWPIIGTDYFIVKDLCHDCADELAKEITKFCEVKR